ncbi:MAG: tripartite tricarboxylate transporter permease [Eubacteriales bacterium]|nr:tripartite tricarboxylate transporter permease [Eubacteriales bacterium]
MSLQLLGNAFVTLMQPSVLLYLMAGVLLGVIIGALPGLSATMGIALITPITFWLPKVDGFAMMMGLWNSAIFAGGITAILINTPGTPASITQSFDGYPLYKRGQGGLALGINTIFSFIGGMISIIMLILVAKPIADFTIKFGSAEYFMIALFGLSMMVAVSGGDILKGLILGMVGVLMSTIGIDPLNGTMRFTFGSTNLSAGIDFIPVMIGLFGTAEIFYQIYSRNRQQEADEQYQRKHNLALGRMLPTRKEMARLTPRSIIVSLVATIIGAIPAAGGDISAVICWGNSKKFSKEGDKYGDGSIEGLAVSSAANNGVIGGAMTTMLTLGLPGDSVTAILLGSLTMYGLQPGYAMFTTNADFTAQIMLLMILANLAFLIIGLVTAKATAKALNISQPTVWAAVCVLCIVGSYCINNRFSDVLVMLVMGVLGFLFRVYKFPTGPLVLGLLLGGTMEKNLRRTLAISRGDWSYFFTRPRSLVIFLLVVVTFALPYIMKAVKKHKQKKQQTL